MTKRINDRLSLIAIFLLLFIIAVGATIWLLDLNTQQQVFGLLVSAVFVAFAILVYFYYVDDPKNLSRRWISAGFASMAALVLLAAAFFAGVGSAPTPNVSVTLYAGEISTSLYGFGNNSNALTSPGPTLTFKVGDVVNMTVINVGQMAHNWALVTANQTQAPVMFNAQVASNSAPLLANQTGFVVFTVTKAGNFYYICQVDAHVQLGMWGSVVVNP